MKSYNFSIFEPIKTTRQWDYIIEAESKQDAEKTINKILESQDFGNERYFVGTSLVDEEYSDNESDYKIEFNGAYED